MRSPHATCQQSSSASLCSGSMLPITCCKLFRFICYLFHSAVLICAFLRMFNTRDYIGGVSLLSRHWGTAMSLPVISHWRISCIWLNGLQICIFSELMVFLMVCLIFFPFHSSFFPSILFLFFVHLVAARELHSTREGLMTQMQISDSSSSLLQHSTELSEAFGGESVTLRQRHVPLQSRINAANFQDSEVSRSFDVHAQWSEPQEGFPQVPEGRFRNYSESKCGPLSIALRKLIFLMPAMQLRKLQRRLLDADKIHSDKVLFFLENRFLFCL